MKEPPWIEIRDQLPEAGRRVELNEGMNHGNPSNKGVITNHPCNDHQRVVFRPDDAKWDDEKNGYYIGRDYLTRYQNPIRWRYIDTPDTTPSNKENNVLCASSIRIKSGFVPVIFQGDSEGDFNPLYSTIIWQGDLAKPYTDVKGDDGTTKTGTVAAMEAASEVIDTFYADGIEAAAKKVLK